MSAKAGRTLRRATVTSLRAAKVVGFGAAASFALGIKRAAEFEDKMADVRKVMEFDTPDGFQNLSTELIEMSKRMPNTAADLAAIAAVAGQSGTAMQDLTAFTELSAKAATAFGMSAEDTAVSLASIREQLGLTQQELERNADVTNALANNLNATEAQVLSFNKRVAATGKQAGFSNEQTQAFGASMIATGAEAEVAATSFRNMTKALTAGDSASGRQKKALKLLGTTAKKTAQNMQKDAVGTVITLLERLNELPEASRGAASLDLFGSEARALTPLITNVDLLRKALGIVNDETKVGNAVNKEYAQRLKTTVEQARIFRNRLDAMLIKVGNTALPTINNLFDPVATGVENSIEFMTNKLENFKQFLDGFFTELGFEGGASDAFGQLAKQLGELFGDGNTDRGEQLGQAFYAGTEAARELEPILGSIKESLTAIAALDLPSIDLGITGDMAAGLFTYAAAMTAINIPLKLLTGMKLTPIRALVRTMAKLAGHAGGLGKVAKALTGIAGAAGAAAAAGGTKPRRRGGRMGRFARGAGGAIAAGELLDDGQISAANTMAGAGMMAGPAGAAAGYVAGTAIDVGRGIHHAATNKRAQAALARQRRQQQEENLMGQFVAPSMSNEQLRAEGAKTTAIAAEQLARIQAILERNKLSNQLEMTPGGKVSAEVTGEVKAELEGKADVNVHVKVTGPARVTGATVSGTGHVEPSIGTDTTGEAP
jgi:TP901 family phage tail tape measure protein